MDLAYAHPHRRARAPNHERPDYCDDPKFTFTATVVEWDRESGTKVICQAVEDKRYAKFWVNDDRYYVL